jgi:hypothetical protein
MAMTIEQARATSKLLSDAADAAEAQGNDEIELSVELDAMDDAGRADQEAALAELQAK